MTRKEIKSLALDKLRNRWTNFILLVLIVWIVQALASFLISLVENIEMSSILGLCNTFLLTPFLESLSIIYVIKFIDRDEKISLKESLPSFKVWRNFIKKMLALILFELPGSLISVIAIIIIFINLFSNHIYEYLFIGYINYDSMMSETLGMFIIVMIFLCVYNIIISLYFFPVKYIIAEETELGIWEAVGKAFKMMKGHKWELFLLNLSLIGWAILGFIPVVLGIIIVFVFNLSMYILPIFFIPLLWLIVYVYTIYRVYYLSISERALEIGRDQLNREIEVQEEDFDIKE